MGERKPPVPAVTVAAADSDTIWVFGDFRLSRHDGLSRRGANGRGEPVMLGSRALDLLHTLVGRQGELVTKHDLMEATWPGLAVEESNLSVQFSTLRRALDEGRRDGSCIQTVIGRGYRFLPAVSVESAIMPDPGPADATPAPPGFPGPTVAVLPFINFSRDPRWESFCDGLVEDIITGLTRQRDLLLIARQSSAAFKGRTTDIREIGRTLGARYIVEGSVQVRPGHLRVTAQLIDSTTGVTLWANHYSRKEVDLFDVQEDIVDHVLAALGGLGGAILQAELTAARRKRPATLQAYELYLLSYEQEERSDREGTLRAIELVNLALAADPHLARAWIVLAWSLGTAMQNGWIEDTLAARARERAAVLKAAELDPGDSIALAALTGLLFRENNFTSARETTERALAAGANHADTLALIAKYVACVLDRPDEAMTLMARSFAINPSVPTWYYLNHIRVPYFARRFDMVLDHFARLVSDPAIGSRRLRAQKLFRVLALAQLDRVEDAGVALRDLRVVDPTLAVISREAAGLSPNARDLFRDGLRKAGLADFSFLIPS